MLKGNMCSNFVDHLCSNNQVKSKLMEDLFEQLMSTIKSTSMMNEILIWAPIFLRIMARHNLKSAMTLHWLCVAHPIRTRCKTKNVRLMPTYFTGIGLWREIKFQLTFWCCWKICNWLSLYISVKTCLRVPISKQRLQL